LPDPTPLDELPDDVWHKWQALALVDDWGHDRFADLASAIHNSLMLMASKLGGAVAQSDLKSADDYQRKFAWERPKRERTEGNIDGFDLLKHSIGF